MNIQHSLKAAQDLCKFVKLAFVQNCSSFARSEQSPGFIRAVSARGLAWVRGLCLNSQVPLYWQQREQTKYQKIPYGDYSFSRPHFQWNILSGVDKTGVLGKILLFIVPSSYNTMRNLDHCWTGSGWRLDPCSWRLSCLRAMVIHQLSHLITDIPYSWYFLQNCWRDIAHRSMV